MASKTTTRSRNHTRLYPFRKIRLGLDVSMWLYLTIVVSLAWCLFTTSNGFAPSNHYYYYFGASSLLSKSSLLVDQSALAMGLYDTPLPPRPPPRDGNRPFENNNNNNNNNNDDDDEEDDDDDILQVTKRRLFSFTTDGTEVSNLLPSLGRRLDLGMGCYFETTDRKVIILAQQANCHPEDAAWALEACQADVTEAWTRISVAQRLALESTPVRSRRDGQDLVFNNNKNNNNNDDNDDPFIKQMKAELNDLLQEEEFQERKEMRNIEELKRKRQDYFRGSEKDAKWLPINNPKPVDDEPWFTG